MEGDGFSFWTAVAFTVNYIMGCGFLGIPHAFVAAGIILGPCVIVIFGYLVNMTKDFVLEAMARTEAMVKITSGEVSSFESLREEDFLVSSHLKFEVTDLFCLLMGPRARTAYMLVLSGYMYGALWAYGTVFASSFTANVPLPGFNGGHTCNVESDGMSCLRPFLLWLGVFGLIAVPLACMELKEQVAVQIVMFAARILVVLLMTGTVLAGYSCDGVVFTDQGTDHKTTAPFANGPGLATVMPIATYAFIFHHSIPVLSQPVADKRSLPRVFLAAFLITGLAYASLGTILAVWFGESVESQANLNWHYYVGCVAAPADGSPVDPSSKSALASAISFIILIFPALDVLSAYPLNAVTLGNNLLSAAFPEAAYQLAEEEARQAALAKGEASGVGLLSRDEEAGDGLAKPRSRLAAWCCGWRSWSKARWLRTWFRLLAAVPPIVAGALSTYYGINLGQILQFTGLIGVAIAFFIPSLLRAWSYAAFLRLKDVSEAREGGTGEGDRLVPSHGIDMPVLGGTRPRTDSGPSSSRPRIDLLVPGVRWRDLLTSKLPVPSAMSTPYSHWAARVGGDRAMFAVALGMAGFVLAQMVTGGG